ncbi:MAG: DUF4349 domain-containing protein [Saprospiraceae bacterium]
MAQSFKSRFRKTLVWLAAGFLLFFVFRLAREYWAAPYESELVIGSGNFADSGEQSLRRNYATHKAMKAAVTFQDAPAGNGQAQKYEQMATVRTQATRFTEEQSAAKTKIRDFGGIIQYEKNQGNPGSQTLFLQIGVAPALFDSFYLEMQKFGKVFFKESTKTDMTSEFLRLNAKRTSLEKTRAALMELKSRGGNIEEFVSLENNLLEIEKQLQELGVELGSFDEENEFCTVRFYLVEGQEPEIGFWGHAMAALEWTISYYLLFLFCLILGLVATWLVLTVVDKWGVMIKINQP